MDSLERLMSAGSHHPTLAAATRSQNAFVQANLCSVIGRKGRHLTGTFCLTGDTMEGIIQCLVFLKAFSVRIIDSGHGTPLFGSDICVPRNVSVVSVVRRCRSVITKARLI